MIFSAYSYVTDPAIAEAFTYMGFPSFFRIELAFAKLIGAIVLILPLTRKIKEWTYAGFAIVFISAFISHSVSGHPFSASLMPLIFLALLIVSYVTFNNLGAEKLKEITIKNYKPGESNTLTQLQQKSSI